MKLKLLLLLLLFLCTFIIPAELGKHEKNHEHGKKNEKEKPREKPGHKSGKHRKRVEDLVKDYDDHDDSNDEEEDRGEWLFELQDVKGNCKPNPCLNNGLCEEKHGKFKCKCPKPYRGRRCEKVKPVCKKNTCGFGQCVLTSTPPYFECKCKAPFKPPHCKQVAPCETNICQNGGTCIKDGQDFDCVCKAGYSGKFCQVGPDDCYEGNGESYRGKVSETDDGDDCLFWNSHFILGQGVNPFNSYEDAQGLGRHNFCRNPDGEKKPWCFTKSGKKLRWDYCDVKKCATSNVTRPTPGYIPGSPKPGIHVAVSPTPASHVQASPTPASHVQASPTPASHVQASPTPASHVQASPTPSSHESVSPTPASHESVEATLESYTPGHHSPATTPESHAQAVQPTETQFTTCGKPQPTKALNRIYGGLKTLPGAQPWQVSVQVRPTSTGLSFKHICGGILIKPCWVLTAGHCIDKTKDFQVVLGGTDLAKYEQSEQVLEVVETIVHEKYKETKESVHNDIALLRLKPKNGKCAQESQFVKTACLPREAFPDGSECSISGWGATEQSQYGSNQLLDADVLLISHAVCSSDKVYGKLIDNSMFCAGHMEGGVDSCQGDSGGPLTCVRNQTHYAYGIVSWGDSCGEKNKPGVYTQVTQFLDWINAKTSSKAP